MLQAPIPRRPRCTPSEREGEDWEVVNRCLPACLPVPSARNRFRRSGRSILNRKSDLTCTVQRPLRSLARSFVRSFFGVESRRWIDKAAVSKHRRWIDRRRTDGRRDGFRLLCGDGGGGSGKHRRVAVADHCRNFPPNRTPLLPPPPPCPSNGRPRPRH